jgi:hemin uptake protein HemP
MISNQRAPFDRSEPSASPSPRLAPNHNTPRTGATQIASTALFLGAGEVEIKHGDVIYRLRQTSTGKLILTK